MAAPSPDRQAPKRNTKSLGQLPTWVISAMCCTAAAATPWCCPCAARAHACAQQALLRRCSVLGQMVPPV